VLFVNFNANRMLSSTSLLADYRAHSWSERVGRKRPPGVGDDSRRRRRGRWRVSASSSESAPRQHDDESEQQRFRYRCQLVVRLSTSGSAADSSARDDDVSFDRRRRSYIQSICMDYCNVTSVRIFAVYIGRSTRIIQLCRQSSTGEHLAITQTQTELDVR